MWSIMIALVLGAAELLAFLFVTLFPNQFQPDPATVRTVINMSEYQTFLAQEFDGELGWTNPVSATLPSRNCVGEAKTYTFDDRGARWSGLVSGRRSTSSLLATPSPEERRPMMTKPIHSGFLV